MSIYFLQYGNLVKIGFSSNLPKRISAIIASIPGDVKFLGHMPGDRDVEAHLHKQFEADRFSGEWFQLTERSRLLIEVLADQSAPAHAIKPRSNFGTRSEDKLLRKERAERLRAAASVKFPRAHRAADKIRLIADEIGWGERRVKSVFCSEPYGLTPSEHTEIERWISAHEPEAAVAQDIAPEVYREDEDK